MTVLRFEIDDEGFKGLAQDLGKPTSIIRDCIINRALKMEKVA